MTLSFRWHSGIYYARMRHAMCTPLETEHFLKREHSLENITHFLIDVAMFTPNQAQMTVGN